MSQSGSPTGQDVTPTSPEGQDGGAYNGSPGSGTIPTGSLGGRAALIAAQRFQAAQVSRASQEAQILSSVRNMINALEDKLSQRIEHVTSHVAKTGDGGLTRVNSKLLELEKKQSDLGRSVAKLSGAIEPMSEEIRRHEERMSAMDTRVGDVRRQLEEDFQTKLLHLDQSLSQLSRTIAVNKSANEDVLTGHNQRILALESHTENHMADAQDKSQSITQLHVRLTEVEDSHVARSREGAIMPAGEPAPRSLSGPQDKLAVAAIESQVSENWSVIQQVKNDMQADRHELHTRVESLVERVATLKKRQEDADQKSRALDERIVKENSDMKLKDFDVRMGGMEKQWGELMEQSEKMHHRINQHSDKHSELGHTIGRHVETAVRRYQEETDRYALMGGEGFDQAGALAPYSFGVGGGGEGDLQVLTQVTQLEDRINNLSQEIREVRSDAQIAPRVASLIGNLQEISPKVIEHEAALVELRAMQEKVQSGDTEGVQAKLEDHLSKLELVSTRQTSMESNFETSRSLLDRVYQEVEGIKRKVDHLRSGPAEHHIGEDGQDAPGPDDR